MLSGYTLEWDYDKKGARTWDDVKKTDVNSIVSLKVGYSVAPNVIMYVVSRTYYDANGNGTKSMSAETRIRF